MARTTYEAVVAILETDLEQDQVERFIDDASLWVTAKLATDPPADEVLEAIERYLACHLCTLRERRLADGGMGDVSESYEGPNYLDMAVALDGRVKEAFDPPEGSFPFKYAAGRGYACP